MSGPTVNIKQGTLLGTTGTNLDGEEFYKFLGVPYAKPPLGALRFKAPQPLEPWEGTRECTKDGNTCLCVDITARDSLKLQGSEDCLFLNVHTRALPRPGLKPKPVMVFIHGGGFTVGAGTEAMADPTYLLTQDIVLVSMNYRLGIFGFLSLEDTSLEVPGNAGLKDQTMALKWVQENISSFNGDPNNVTIFGVSAGGASVQFQILSPTAKGLFHKAIAQSGSALNPWAWGQRNSIQVAKKLGNPVSSEKQALEILMNLPAEELYKLQLAIPDDLVRFPIRRPFGPVIEKPNPTAFLTEEPYTLLANGKFNQVDLIQGLCSNEGFVIEFPFGGKNCMEFNETEDAIPWFLVKNGKVEPSWQDSVHNFYYKDGVNKLKMYDHVSDAGFALGILESVKLALKHSKRPSYLYLFDYDVPLGHGIKAILKQPDAPGISHGIDGNFLFPMKWFLLPTMDLSDDDKAAIKTVVKIWTDFARTGKPYPSWEPVKDINNLNYLYINKYIEMRSNMYAERFALWEEICKEAGGIDCSIDVQCK